MKAAEDKQQSKQENVLAMQINKSDGFYNNISDDIIKFCIFIRK